jgi:hypothetical protein
MPTRNANDKFACMHCQKMNRNLDAKFYITGTNFYFHFTNFSVM